MGIPPAFPHPVVDCCFSSLRATVPSRPSPLSLPLHPSWPPLLPHRCRPINLRHRLFNSLPLLMIRHVDCRPLLAASTSASNASLPPPFKTGVNKINNVRFQPPSPLPPSSPPSSTASAYLSPPRRLHCCDVRQTTRTTDDNVGTVNTVSIIIIVVVIGYLDDDDDDVRRTAGGAPKKPTPASGNKAGKANVRTEKAAVVSKKCRRVGTSRTANGRPACSVPLVDVG